jgi:hypothetical protein
VVHKFLVVDEPIVSLQEADLPFKLTGRERREQVAYMRKRPVANHMVKQARHLAPKHPEIKRKRQDTENRRRKGNRHHEGLRWFKMVPLPAGARQEDP